VITKRVLLDFAGFDGVQLSPGRVEAIGGLSRDAEPTRKDPRKDKRSALRQSKGIFSVAGLSIRGQSEKWSLTRVHSYSGQICTERSALHLRSARGHEDHGYEWGVPWWDNRPFVLWGRVPPTFRLGRRLLNACVDGLERSRGLEGLPGQREDAARRFIATSALRRRFSADWHGLERTRGPRALNPTISWRALVAGEIPRRPYSGIENINSCLSRAYVSGGVG
jgi:hypothetical protein